MVHWFFITETLTKIIKCHFSKYIYTRAQVSMAANSEISLQKKKKNWAKIRGHQLYILHKVIQLYLYVGRWDILRGGRISFIGRH